MTSTVIGDRGGLVLALLNGAAETRIGTPLVVIALATASQVAVRTDDVGGRLSVLQLASRLHVAFGRSHLQARPLHAHLERT